MDVNATPRTESLLEQARRRTELPDAASNGQRAVQDVITHNLGRYFAPDPGGAVPFALNADLHPAGVPIGGGDREVVSWEFVGVHARSFRGVAATGRPVWFRGLTVLDRTQERVRYHHFIDWREVLIQLGIAPEATRPLQGREDVERLTRVRASGWTPSEPRRGDDSAGRLPKR